MKHHSKSVGNERCLSGVYDSVHKKTSANVAVSAHIGFLFTDGKLVAMDVGGESEQATGRPGARSLEKE